ncbi:PD-(D/E)XK nuclease domain-containing protein, partial [bacterium]|nr:PD-(D/E)XK nuclease domain-containing protein [bacterium]
MNRARCLYASIANDWYRKNELAGFEGYHASVFYSYFAALGLDIRLEDPSNVGRIDMSVLFAGQVFLFEFKVVELSPQGRALQQIKTLHPAASHQSLNSGLRLPMLAIM